MALVTAMKQWGLGLIFLRRSFFKTASWTCWNGSAVLLLNRQLPPPYGNSIRKTFITKHFENLKGYSFCKRHFLITCTDFIILMQFCFLVTHLITNDNMLPTWILSWKFHILLYLFQRPKEPHHFGGAGVVTQTDSGSKSSFYALMINISII
jgi:hypothetical protein